MQPRAVGVYLIVAALIIFALYLAPPRGHLYPDAAELQAWFRMSLFDRYPNARRDEVTFGTGLLVTLLVSAWNWMDSFLDFTLQRNKKPRQTGEYLASRSAFRRESYRLWRVSSMFLVACALIFNWGLSSLILTFGFLVFSFSEMTNSLLDRLYRLEAQDFFREDRERRQRILTEARMARYQASIATATAATTAYQGRIEEAISKNTEAIQRAANLAAENRAADKLESQEQHTEEGEPAT